MIDQSAAGSDLALFHGPLASVSIDTVRFKARMSPAQRIAPKPYCLFLPQPSCMNSMVAGTRVSRGRDREQRSETPARAAIQLGLMACLALLVGASVAAQEVITLPLGTNGKPLLPPGAVTETAYVIDAFAGTGERGFHGDGGPATKARFESPGGIALDAAGNLYVADSHNGRVRRIDPSGNITTIAGNGEQGSAGDGGPMALT